MSADCQMGILDNETAAGLQLRTERPYDGNHHHHHHFHGNLSWFNVRLNLPISRLIKSRRPPTSSLGGSEETSAGTGIHLFI